MIVVAFVSVWLSSSWCDGWLCRLSTTIWFSLLWCDIYLCFDDLNEQSIYDQKQKIKSIIVNIRQNLSQKYYSNNNNIKCIDSTIKYI